ncbi:MAG TPA: GNAT family protein, partial [Conexibacter sp.]
EATSRWTTTAPEDASRSACRPWHDAGVTSLAAAVWDVLTKPLAGSLVTLEPLEERHAEDLRAACADPRVSRWLPVPLHEPQWFAWWLEDGLAALAERREVTFATVRRADGVAIGSTRFMELRERDRSVEIGWTWLAPAVWGTGANVEAKLLMLGRAFEQAGCIRVELKTDARNERSRAAMAALPAQFEGIHRQHRVLLDGSYRDSAWYSVLDREWPDVRASLERRLAARA